MKTAKANLNKSDFIGCCPTNFERPKFSSLNC